MDGRSPGWTGSPWCQAGTLPSPDHLWACPVRPALDQGSQIQARQLSAPFGVLLRARPETRALDSVSLRPGLGLSHALPTPGHLCGGLLSSPLHPVST